MVCTMKLYKILNSITETTIKSENGHSVVGIVICMAWGTFFTYGKVEFAFSFLLRKFVDLSVNKYIRTLQLSRGNL